jgi:nucleoside-diphosphate-sugar epimerase
MLQMTGSPVLARTKPVWPDAISRGLRAPDLNVAVIGATGWLGLATLDMLDAALGPESAARVHAFSSQAKEIRLPSGSRIKTEPLTALAEMPDRGRYLFLHYAFWTKDRLQSASHEEFLAANSKIQRAVVSAAERLELLGFFLPSSGAVYRKDGSLETDVKSNAYGFIKLRDEEVFTDICERTASPLTIARIFNLAGPYINKVQRYALSSILLGALHGGRVTLRSAHPVIRSYVDVRDLLEISLRSFFDPQRDPVIRFETAGEREIEIGELAQLARDHVVGGNVRIDRPNRESEPVDRFVGDPTVLRQLAKSYGVHLRLLVDQMRDTAKYLSSSRYQDWVAVYE